MKFLEEIHLVIATADTLVALLGRAKEVWNRLRQLVQPQEKYAYDNLSIQAVVDIKRPDGSKAVVIRRQTVRFLRNDQGVVRELMWGDGEQAAHVTTQGARRLGVRREGSKRVVLLALDHAARAGQRSVVRTRRLMRGAFGTSTEYFEMLVERPTKSLSLRVLFPRTRRPKDVRVDVTPPDGTARRVPVRLDARGRPFIAWRKAYPALFAHYSLRWSW